MILPYIGRKVQLETIEKTKLVQEIMDQIWNKLKHGMIIINLWKQNKENLIDSDAWEFDTSKFSNGMYSDMKFHYLYFSAFKQILEVQAI